MVDSGFPWRAESDAGRLAALYTPDPTTGVAVQQDALGARSPPGACGTVRRRRTGRSAGGLPPVHRDVFLVATSTACDYLAFAFDYMTAQPPLPDLETNGRPLFAETTFDGTGFRGDSAVVDDPVKGKVPRHAQVPCVGRCGRLAAFWVDPVEEIAALLLTQQLLLEHPPDPVPAEPAGVPGARRLATPRPRGPPAAARSAPGGLRAAAASAAAASGSLAPGPIELQLVANIGSRRSAPPGQ